MNKHSTTAHHTHEQTVTQSSDVFIALVAEFRAYGCSNGKALALARIEWKGPAIGMAPK